MIEFITDLLPEKYKAYVWDVVAVTGSNSLNYLTQTNVTFWISIIVGITVFGRMIKSFFDAAKSKSDSENSKQMGKNLIQSNYKEYLEIQKLEKEGYGMSLKVVKEDIKKEA